MCRQPLGCGSPVDLDALDGDEAAEVEGERRIGRAHREPEAVRQAIERAGVSRLLEAIDARV